MKSNVISIFTFVVLTLLLNLFGESSGGSVPFHDCGSKATVKDLRVTGCTSEPCVFRRGSTYDFEVDAVADEASSTLPYKVTAETFIPITLLKGNACDDLTVGKCPSIPGEFFSYKNTVKVHSEYPSMHTTVKAVVMDDKQSQQICIEVKVEITKAKSSILTEVWSWFHEVTGWKTFDEKNKYKLID